MAATPRAPAKHSQPHLPPLSEQLAYGYVSGNPLAWTDPFGLRRSKKKKPNRRVNLHNTYNATIHYFFGDSEPAQLSDRVKDIVKNHPNVKEQTEKNRNGIGIEPCFVDLDFRMALDWRTFHLGRTKVAYTEECAGGTCITNYSAAWYDNKGNPDRYQDPLGIGWEPGTPYSYETFEWSSEPYDEPQEENQCRN